MNGKNTALFCLALALLAGPVFAQEAGGGEGLAADTAEDRVYRIRAVSFEVDGWTRPFALMRAGEFKEGERLTGKAGLEGYIADKTQLLMNQRVLERVEIDYTPGEEEEGEIPVDLLVRVKDSWNIFVLPYPKYDDNTGFELILKGRDYNFLGTMSPLRLDLGWKRSTGGENSFIFEIDSDTPFQAFGFTWNFNFDHAFSYTYGKPLYYKNTTGISMELPFHATALTFGFNQHVFVNEENSDRDKRDGYGERFDGAYTTSELYTAWRIPTGLAVGNFGELSYTPRLTGLVNYRPGGTVDYPRQSPVFSFSQALGFGRVDWIGNYRRGLEASLENFNAYNFGKEKWDRSLSLTGTGYVPFSSFFGISGRVKLRSRFDDPLATAGDDLRGLLDSWVRADTMLSVNMDFPLRAVRLYPSELFNNPKLRIFDFELHLSPFIDLALVQGRIGDPDGQVEEHRFSHEDMLFTGGLEVIYFPAITRSIYIRASLGYNIKEAVITGKIGKWDELFIGLGHHY